MSTGRSLIVHIGPRKTGTSSIQESLAERREQLRDAGVIYPGAGKQHFQAVNRFIGRRQFWETDVSGDVVEGPWRQMLQEIGDAPQGVISTEVLSQARPEHIARMFDSAPDRSPTVVITYRHLEELLTSTWQQLVKEGLRDPLDGWARAAAVDHPELSADPFPRILDLSTLVDIWGGVVGPENVVIVLVDRSDPHRIFSAFEDVLGLPGGFLVPQVGAAQKRSLTAEEAEFLRQTNSRLPRDRETLKSYRAFRRSLAPWLDENPPIADATRLALSPEVAKMAHERSEAMVQSLRALSGRLRIFGDLDSLLSTRPAAEADASLPTTMNASVAAQWLAMAMQSSSAAGES